MGRPARPGRAPGHGNIVSLAECARTVGCAPQTLLSWTRIGCPYLRKGDKKKSIAWEFNTAEVNRWMIDRAVADAIGDVAQTDTAELKKRKLRAEVTIAELDAAKQRGQVGDLSEFEARVYDAAVNFRTRLRQMGARVAPMLLGVKKVTQIKKILADEIDQALIDLSDDLGAE